MSKSQIKKRFFLSGLAFALLFVFPFVLAVGAPEGTFDVTGASFNNFFVSSGFLSNDIESMSLASGAFEVRSQPLLKGFHKRNDSFGYEFVYSINGARDFTFASPSGFFSQTPESSLIGNALSVSPQIILNGWHLRNHVFFVDWQNNKNLGKLNVLPPSNILGTASELMVSVPISSFIVINNSFYYEIHTNAPK